MPRVLVAVLVRRRQMAVQRFDGQSIERAAQRLLNAQPQPVHAGVDHDVARLPLARFTPALHLFDAVEHRSRREQPRGDHVTRTHSVQDRQRHPRRQRHQRRGLGPSGDEKVAATRRGQMPHHFARAETIAIGLQRRTARRRAALGGQPAPVGNKRFGRKAQAER